jgi:hypothetical protein
MFCHKALKLLVMDNKSIVDDKTIKRIVEDEAKFGLQKENLFHTL